VWKWGKWTLALVGTVTLALASYVVFQNRRDHNLVRTAEAEDKVTLSELRAAFPVGTSLEAVHAGLRSRNLDGPIYQNEMYLLRGYQPSFTWYCGPYTRYIRFKFSSNGKDGQTRLLGIDRQVRGLNCL